tara:strand:- start:548 stop:667 length:120 start_codon:yes stop_codon:yes gene_type:complete
MTMYHGLGMFILGMFAIIVGGMIAWYVINKVVKDDEEER